MQRDPLRFTRPAAWAFLFCLLAGSAAQAQTRVTIPAGSVIMVRTQQPLQSATAKVGQTFETTVLSPVSVNGYTLIPANSRIRGVVSYVQAASGSRSGVMQIGFDRVTLPNGASFSFAGRLTSTDAEERRQIEQRSDPRVVLVGNRGGIGAAIAGAGSTSSAASGILAALGNMLSEGMNVDVPAGTQLAVQLERDVSFTAVGAVNTSDESTIFTAADRIRAAQQALASKGMYRGAITGTLDNATRRAIFEYQLDNRLTATGNLDGRTARALGISNANRPDVLSAEDAAVLRRAAQAIQVRLRQDLSIDTSGRMVAARRYTAAEMELLFAFSAFADNASLYEQFVRTPRNGEGTRLSGRALVNAARRVDAAIQQQRPSSAVVQVWDSIRRQLVDIDPRYGQ
jgi:peptidoglycan hydrolase-like protein with peptidoglycan-binding domain